MRNIITKSAPNPVSTFYGEHQVELIYANQYTTIEEAKSAIFEYIEIFHNLKRRHSANANVSSVAFEKMAALDA